MYLVDYSLKNIKRNAAVYAAFGILLILLFTVLFVFFAVSDKTLDKVNEMEREYGCAYGIQENFGYLVSKNIYDDLHSSPFVTDIKFEKYTQVIAQNNLTLRINQKPAELGCMMILVGLPDFPANLELLNGSFPKNDSECVVEKSLLGDISPGDMLSIQDGFSGNNREFKLSGIIDKASSDSLINTYNFTGAIVITTMGAASSYYSSNQQNTFYISGIVPGFDATVYLSDYRYGQDFRKYVSQLTYDSRSYSAYNKKQGYESSVQQMVNLINICSLVRRIITVISFLVIILFVLLRTNLRTKEICILRSMGLSLPKLVCMSILEYICFLAMDIFLGILFSGTINHLFILDKGYPWASIYLNHIPLILLFFLMELIITPIYVFFVYRLSLIKILRRNIE